MKDIPTRPGIIGIDPGLTGGIALVEIRNSQLCLTMLHDMPVTSEIVQGKTRYRVDPVGVANILRSHAPVSAVAIERQSARPRQGVTSVFALGYHTGILEGAVAALDQPLLRTRPQEWRAMVGHSGDKDEARELASLMFPEHAHQFRRKKDHGRAEATLIAAAGMLELGLIEATHPKLWRTIIE